MQGNDIKVNSSGLYLGMKVSEKGYKDSVDMSIRHRVAKAWGSVADIVSVINDIRMTRVGWLRSAVILIRSVIIPSLTYGADTWIAMNKASEKLLVDEFKSMVYVILEIPTHTKWTSVVADLNIPNIMAVVNKLRINYINHTLWEPNADSKLRSMLREEEKSCKSGKSMLAMVDETCRKYKIPEVSKVQLDKRMVKAQVKLMDEIDVWMSNIKSPVTKNVGMNRMRLSTNFYKLSKRESQALIAHNAGAFKLKTAWGNYFHFQGCLAPLCGGKDDMEHIKICLFYKTKWEEEFTQDSKMLARYLVSIDRERRSYWKGECLF